MKVSNPFKSQVENPTRVAFAGASEAGRVRRINQDSCAVGPVRGGLILAVVADGMGGHNTGEVASQSAVRVLREQLDKASNHPPTALAKAVQAANLDIHEYAQQNLEHRGMGTTLTTVLIDDQIGLVGHIGDSRAYLIRDGGIHQLTQDHSWVADRVRQGVLSADEARHHRWRNVITNALGATPSIKLDIYHFEVRSGDKLLLCSDGVSTLLDDDMLLKVVSELEPEPAVKRLLELANEQGSPDNITAIVLDVTEVIPRSKGYELPKHVEAASVSIGQTGGGIKAVEDAFPKQDPVSKLLRHPLYPYRFWLLGCLYLILMFLIFVLR